VTRPTAQPEEFARALIKRFNISTKPDLSALVENVGLKIRPVESEGFEGALVRIPNKPGGILAIKSDIREPGRKRFTIAHELGHYILPGHGELECVCKSRDIESWSRGVPSHEVDANRFASELLIPLSHVAPLVRGESATVAVARKISDKFETSLTAAMVKCVDVTEEQCALVVSDNGTIQWWRPGPQFRSYIKAKGTEVSIESNASNLFQGTEEREQDGAVPADAWLAGDVSGKVWEDSILLPYYNRVLTIVTVRPGDLQ
jgi:hypothetical protein